MKKTILLIPVMVLLVSIAYAELSDLEDYVVACWNMTDGNDSIGTHHASAISATYLSTGNPITGNGYYSYNDNYFRVPDDDELDWNNNMTIIIVANTTADGAGTDTIIGKKGDYMWQSGGDNTDFKLYCWGTSDYKGTAIDWSGSAWHMLIATFNETNDYQAYWDGSADTAVDVTGCGVVTTNDFFIGTYDENAGNAIIGGVALVVILNTSINSSVASLLYNSGDYFNCTDLRAEVIPDITPTNLTITANNNLNGSKIFIFNATVNGTFYETTNGVINTTVTNVTIAPINITVDSQTYHSVSFINWNEGLSIEANLSKKFIMSVDFTGDVNFSADNYSRNLTQLVNITCSDEGNTSLFTFINSTFYSQDNLTCDNSSQIVTQYYAHPKEGLYTISYSLNITQDFPLNNLLTRSWNFNQDTENPGIIIDFNVSQGFISPSVTLNVTCNDSVSPILNYTTIFNNIILFTGINKSNISVINNTVAIDGVNTAIGICRDFFGSTNATLNLTVHYKTLQLIDEKIGSLFDCVNITSCKIYADDNSTVYDLKSNTTSEVNYTGIDIFNLRVELGYLNNVIITRWIDIRLINTSTLRICANKQGVTHFEQLIISGTERPTVLTNVFADCVVAADTTRFAYQDSLILKAFTINGLYFLYTFSTTGRQILLSSIDGSIAAFINLDTLDFKLSSFNLDILRDALSFRKTGDTEVTLFYQNLEENNKDIRLQIERMDTSVSVLDTTAFTNPNQFTLIFDWSTLSNITNNTLFKTTLTRTTDTGEILSFKKYFNTAGSTGVMNSAVSFTIALLLMIFGLSITTARITFSWFGIIITIASIAILSFAISTWYITLLLGLNTVILVYMVVTLVSLNYPTIT